MSDHPPAAAVSPGGAGAEEALIQLATEIGGYRTVADLFDHLPGHLRPLFPFDGVGIVLHDPATNDVSLALSFGVPTAGLPSEIRRPVHYGPAGWVFQSQQPRYDVLSAETTHPTLTPLYKAGFRSASWLPLSTSRTRLGVFVVVRKTADAVSADYGRLMTWAANIVALALEHIMQVEALERLRGEVADERDRAKGVLYDLGERVKELTALHHTARLLEDAQLGVAELLQRIAALLPPAFQFPEVTEALVRYGETVVRTPGFVPVPWTIAATFATRDGTEGRLEVIYRDERPPSVEGPFLREERHLMNSLADMVCAELDRRAADAALRQSQEHLRSARDRARLLLEITTAVVSELDLRNLLNTVSQLLKETIPHHFASIGLWEEAEQRLRRHALSHISDHHLLEEGRLVSIGSPGDIAFRSGETMVFNWDDILALGEPSVSVMAVEGLRSACCVPLKTARGRYGVLNIGKPNDDPFSPDEVALLEDVASQLAIAFENALSFSQAERYRQESLAQRDKLQLLLDVNNQLLAQPESYAKRLSVLAMARLFVDHDYASLVIWDAEANELRVEANTYYDARGVLEPRVVLPLGLAPSSVAFAEQRIRTFTGAEVDQFDQGLVPGLAHENIRSMCCLPLITQRGTLGTLSIGRRSREGFSDAEVSLLSDVAGQVAIAVANTIAYQEISALKDRITEEKLYLEDEISLQHDFKQIIGTSHALTSVLRQIRTVGPTDATVLLLGETGTGKELLARALHDASKRRSQTFVRVNGAALPGNLIESELFGYEKGAFTGATSNKVGRFELAHRGTLFLDEVGEIPVDIQPKLLRALQEQEFERLGSTRTIKVDVRLIAATNRDLNQMVAGGTFRSDLYYRLSVFPIFVPPLRERPEDIAPLVHHFVRKFSREIGRNIDSISAGTMDSLQKWPWPGNIRELENVIERAVILSSGASLQVPASAFQGGAPLPRPAPAGAGAPAATAAPESAYHEGEREMILKALRDTRGIIAGPDGAAARLGLKRTTLHSKMRKLGIERPSF
ncbi:MAG TPA: sigma 54-interacting transcriptional regulator [Vicinamibacterales bacterium]|jgi:formate hydrogenlyase transcriptional activator|nr:sigma 54-interacting transcriptional regulator [Vicinamibacterales bacterium]